MRTRLDPGVAERHVESGAKCFIFFSRAFQSRPPSGRIFSGRAFAVERRIFDRGFERPPSTLGPGISNSVRIYAFV